MCAFAHVAHGRSFVLRRRTRQSRLVHAIRQNQLTELKSMASSPAALNVRDARGSTPLMYASASAVPTL